MGDPPTIDPDGLVLARLPAPTSSEPTRLAVLSDVHVAMGADGTDRLFHRTEDRLAAAVDRLNRSDPDLVLFCGDLTKDGEPWNFDRFDELVAAFDPPHVGTPGNHDVPKSSDEHRTPTVAAFERRYTPGSLPLVERVGGVDLVVCNSASLPDGSLSDTHRGELSHGQLEWLEGTLPTLSNPVVAMHHNVVPLLGSALADRPPWRTFTLRNREAVGSLLARHDVPLVISGHHHVPAIARPAGLTQLVAPAACAYPQAHLLLEIGPSGTTVRMIPHADRDQQIEAYEAMQASGLRRAFSSLVGATIEAAPVVDEPPEPPLEPAGSYAQP